MNLRKLQLGWALGACLLVGCGSEDEQAAVNELGFDPAEVSAVDSDGDGVMNCIDLDGDGACSDADLGPNDIPGACAAGDASVDYDDDGCPDAVDIFCDGSVEIELKARCNGFIPPTPGPDDDSGDDTGVGDGDEDPADEKPGKGKNNGKKPER